MPAAAVRIARAQDSLRPIPNDRLEIRNDPLKGRGVFARVPIAAGTLIEAAPVIIVPAAECPLCGLGRPHQAGPNLVEGAGQK